MSREIERFEIRVEDAELDDLRRRLAQTRFPDQIEDTGWDQGTDTAWLREIVAYWRDEFDWRAQEKRLNAFDHHRTRVDGQSIHFLHAPSRHAGALPLVASHGWPGSVVEFLDVIEPLRDPEAHGGRAEDAFHVVCPSLPGYGFSEPTRSLGWGSDRIGRAFAELMARLGYTRYGAHGGDWGALVTTELGLCDAEHVCGIHTTMPLALPPPDGTAGLTDAEKADVAELPRWQEQEAGYQRIQQTKPQSLGVALNDSPAGLAAWILEKFRGWSDCGGDPESVFRRDDLLANVTIYWLTQTITSSTRLYYEVLGQRHTGVFGRRVEVPTGVARFPREMMRFPRKWVENHYNVTHWTAMPRGGHFAALEQPKLLVDDLRAFFATVR